MNTPVVIAGMPRPSAVEIANGRGAYTSVAITDGEATWTEHRVEQVGHAPCGWLHPTWPDEAEGRLAAHLMTCEMRP